MAAHHAAIKALSGGISTEKAKQRVSAALMRAAAAPHPGVPPLHAPSTTATGPEPTMGLARVPPCAPSTEEMQTDPATPGGKAGDQPCCGIRATTSRVVADPLPASKPMESQNMVIHEERSKAVSCTTTQAVCRKDGRNEIVYAWEAKLAADKAAAAEEKAKAKAQIAAEKLAKKMAAEVEKQKKREEAAQKKKEQEEAAGLKAAQKAEQAARRCRYALRGDIWAALRGMLECLAGHCEVCLGRGMFGSLAWLPGHGTKT